VRILLTGGAGFIGSHLGEALLARGCEVWCLDNFDLFYPRAYKEANLRGALGSDRYHLVEGDIRDGDLVRRLFAEARPDALIHLAAKAGVRPSVADPAGYASVNVAGTVQLLQVCRETGMRKLVFASSSSVYGDDTPVPFREDAPANRPASPYAATKKAGEELVHSFHHTGHLDAVCLRYFTVYGPRQRPEMAVHLFARHLSAGLALTLYDRGRLQRDFTYVSDAVAGSLGALDYVLGAERCFEVLNLADARTVTLNELLSLMELAFQTRANVRYAERPPGDVERTWADITKAKNLLRFEPRVPLEEGIPLFAEWYAAEGAGLASALPTASVAQPRARATHP
jgi:UDP-glucuronate 4-epimerase